MSFSAPKFAYILEHWLSATDDEITTCKQYIHKTFGIELGFTASVFIHQSMIDIVIKRNGYPTSLLTVMRETGTLIVYGPYDEQSWQTVSVSQHSDEFLRSIGCVVNEPVRMEIINDMLCLDVAVFNSDDECIEKYVIDKETGLIVDRETI